MLRKVVTPVKAHKLETYLQGYDRVKSKTLVDGFRYGFRINSFNFVPTKCGNNLISARQLPDVVDTKLGKDLKLGRYSGPFISSPFKDFKISPLGVREKKTPGKFRLIHNLSYPYDETSVNSSIPKDCATVKYATIVDAIQLINYYGKNCFMAKTDVESAFRIIPVHPMDRHLLGFKWKNSFYFDNCLPMGCSSSCQLFELFSTSLEWIIFQRLTGVGVIHVLDDFFFVASTYDKCQSALNLFLHICEDIGVPISLEKTFGPSQAMPFVGIQLDSVSMEASLPEDKVLKFTSLIDEIMSVKSTTLKQVQSLTGMLNFACGIIAPARAFTRRLYDITIGIVKPFHHVKITKQIKLDLQVWKNFMSNHNRKTFLLDYIWVSNEHLQLFTDASTTIGFGGYFQDKWFHGIWPVACKGLNIALLELYPICLALHLWGEQLTNKCITINTDNMAIVYVLNNNTSKDPLIMLLVRKLVLLCMKLNILIRAQHISTKLNTVSDMLSRDQIRKALQLAPHLQENPVTVPPQWTLVQWLAELGSC